MKKTDKSRIQKWMPITADKTKGLIILAATALALLVFSLFLIEENSSLQAQKSLLEQEKNRQELELSALEESLEKSTLSGKSLKSEFDSLNKDYKELRALHAELESDFDEVNNEKNALEKEVSSVSSEYEKVKDAVEETIAELNEFEKEVNDSIQWFKDNAEFGSGEKEDFMKRMLRENCYYTARGNCLVKTGCIYFINWHYLDLRYGYDLNDNLQPVNRIMQSEKGDCEDYALLFKAELNDFIGECSTEDIEIESYTYTPPENALDTPNLQYFVDKQKLWFLTKAYPVKLTGYHYPAVVCGLIYDLQAGRAGGHCVIALTKKKIENSGQIQTELDNAPLIEPQNGAYMGKINSDSQIRLNRDGEEKPEESNIYLIITDNDHYSFDSEKLKWKGYSDYLSDIENQKQELQKLE